MATGNNQEEIVRIMTEGMNRARLKGTVLETETSGDVVVENKTVKKETEDRKVGELVPWEEKYPNGLGTFDLILKEQRRTNSLLTQLRNHALGIPMSPQEIEESNNE